jgi:ubiquinone/menaquinone biosynthesis C-methylase UbiE
MKSILSLNYDAINRAFSKQAEHYDADDVANPILTDWRKQVYTHVDKFLKPESYILELNAGTGIDAVRFVNKGHRVLATDISDGMIDAIMKKIKTHSLLGKLSCQKCSFELLEQVREKKFDFIFSNFGGLNCTDDLSKVTRHFSSLLKPGGYVTLVIMPPICLWEWLWIFKGHGGKAFRRLSKNGTLAHLEGELFQTFYHTVRDVKKSMGINFKSIALEGLGVVSPPPSKPGFVSNHPRLYNFLRKVDSRIRFLFPFNWWADHTIITLQFSPSTSK